MIDVTGMEFVSRLKALLAEFGAEIEAKDHYIGYPECGEDVRMTVYFKDPYSEINLGSWVDSDVPPPLPERS